MKLFNAFSLRLLRACKFEVSPIQFESHQNIIIFSLAQIFIILLYYIALFFSCWKYPLLNLTDCIAWILSLGISISELYKRNINGYNKFEAIKNQDMNIGVTPCELVFWRQFYTYSFRISSFLVVLTAIMRIVYEILICFTQSSFLFVILPLKIMMTLSMAFVMCPTIVLVLFDLYEAEDIYILKKR